MNIHEETLKIARNLIKKDPSLTDWVISKFPELKESEDERIRKEIRDFICWATDRGSITKEQMEKSNLWLAWLEKRGEQKPTEWSEEDENNINSIVSRLEVDISYWESRSKTRTNEDKKLIGWLKSIIPQSAWKPSDEQMKALEESIMFLGTSCVSISQFALKSLYQDLKKLKE